MKRTLRPGLKTKLIEPITRAIRNAARAGHLAATATPEEIQRVQETVLALVAQLFDLAQPGMTGREILIGLYGFATKRGFPLPYTPKKFAALVKKIEREEIAAAKKRQRDFAKRLARRTNTTYAGTFSNLRNLGGFT